MIHDGAQAGQQERAGNHGDHQLEIVKRVDGGDECG